MLSLKALRNQKRVQRIVDDNMKSKPVKIIPCSEDDQIYSYQKTNKKSLPVPRKEFERQLKKFNIKPLR
jgi:hypothetical protein